MAEEEKTEVVEESGVVAEAEAEVTDTAEDVAAEPKRAANTVPVVICAVAAVVALVLGFLLGHFINFGGGGASVSGGSSLAGKLTLTEDELDSVVGTYEYNGQSYSVTARETIEDNSSLDAARQDDGSYTVPSADYILSSARNGILQKEVEAQGITVTDEDIDEYAESTLGSTDYSTIASEYSMDEDQVKTILKQSCGVKKLYDSVVGTDTSSVAPEAPTTPAEGEEDTPSAEYGAYIVALLGDEWDSASDTWARTDGPYYASMSSMDFSGESATYSQAETAYYVAYQAYSETASDASATWTEYLNGLLSNATIAIATLVS